MRVTDKLRYLSKDIIKGYVHHVDKCISQGNSMYIESGIDLTLERYEALFTIVIKRFFSYYIDTKEFSEDIINDCVGALDLVVEDSKYKSALPKYSAEVCDTCLMIYKQVEEGVRNGK